MIKNLLWGWKNAPSAEMMRPFFIHCLWESDTQIAYQLMRISADVQTNDAVSYSFLEEIQNIHAGAEKGTSNWLPTGSPNLKVYVFLILFFNVFPHHLWDGLLMDLPMCLWSVLASFLWLVWTSWGIFSKLADLCKSIPRPHGSMVFNVSALCFLIFVHMFLMVVHVSFRFVFASTWDAMLIRFGLHVWALRGQKVVKMSS